MPGMQCTCRDAPALARPEVHCSREYGAIYVFDRAVGRTGCGFTSTDAFSDTLAIGLTVQTAGESCGWFANLHVPGTYCM